MIESFIVQSFMLTNKEKNSKSKISIPKLVYIYFIGITRILPLPEMRTYTS
ncbi:hypothetical protein Fokcrypt_00439 [Candidatus Fokinia cryptica]|uniref:Transposase n=1 Tax=Candidatus Fokinia crypta TaxID=1920990 RepID=A0ABZ0UP52_9RICK|nr:hypothetical protein Fokcrypt_00439 [Candidatus Fokinia cryptica]